MPARAGAPRRCGLVALLALAVATAEDCERALVIPPDGRLSGKGKLWEYYHFLIDFCPRVAYALRNSSCARTVVHVPGWFNDDRFSLALTGTPRTMAPLAATLFAGRGLRLAPYPQHRPPPAALERLDFGAGYHWSEQPRAWLDHFNSHARALAAPVGAVGGAFDVLLVRRGAAPPNAPKCARMRCATGAARRKLPAAFFEGARARLGAVGVRVEEAVLERLPLLAQVRLFAQAPLVVAMHGAGLSNLVFAARGAAVVEVGLRANFCYVRLAGKMGLHYAHSAHGKRGFTPEVESIVRRALAAARARLRLAAPVARRGAGDDASRLRR